MEPVEEIDDAPQLGVWMSRLNMDHGEEVVGSVVVFVLQFSTSPVAAGCIADDDSNGSTARLRFNLEMSC